MKKIIVMAAVMAFMSACYADIVSWNYNCWGDAYGSGAQSTSIAGVESASYWNDTWLDGRNTDLLDNTGAATTIDISWTAPAAYSIVGYHTGADADGSYNREVINGYLNAGVADWTTIAQSSVTLSEIGYSSYNVIVYFSSDVAGRTGTVTDGTTTYYFNALGSASIASSNALFVQATNTTEDGYAVAANYAVFYGLSGDSQTFTVDIPSWGGIAAIQIIGIPEPATMLLLGLGGVLLRKKK